jgi:hypothetical protein
MDGSRLARGTLVVAAIVWSLVLAAPAAACTRTWASPQSGAWSDGAAWSPAGVPTASDDVCLPGTRAYTVTLSAPATVASLSVGGEGSGSPALEITAARVPGDGSSQNASLTATNGGTIAENGTVELTAVFVDLAGPGIGTGGSAILAGGTIRNDGAFVTTIVATTPPHTTTGAPSTLGAYLRASLVNGPTGTVRLVDGLFFMDAGTTLENHGMVQADTTWVVTTNPALSATHTRIVNAGAVTEGYVALRDADWTQAGGSVVGDSPISIEGGALDYESGTGSFTITGSSAATLAGTIPRGQTVTIGDAPVQLLGPSVVNRGTLQIALPPLWFDEPRWARQSTITGAPLDNLGALTVQYAAVADLRTDLTNERRGRVRLAGSLLIQDVGTSTTNRGTFSLGQHATYSLRGRSRFRNDPGAVLVLALDPPASAHVLLGAGATLAAGGGLTTTRSFGYSPDPGTRDRLVVGSGGIRTGRFTRLSGGGVLAYGAHGSIALRHPRHP